MSFQLLTYGWIILAALTHISLFYITAPFGRHTSSKFGISINNKLGWFVMELPSLLIMAYFLLFGTLSLQSFAWILFALWILHYSNRTFIYPLRIKATPKKIPLMIVANAILFNIINAGLNGYYLAELAPSEDYNRQWLGSFHFIAGALLFFTGMCINWISDSKLISLRKDGSTGYKIPYGFLFNQISTPNLLGEIVEWCGFALMAWNLPALSFAIWTYANLVPRAIRHHQWYQKTFPDYPKNRKAIFPFIY